MFLLPISNKNYTVFFETHILYTELANGVVHQDSEVFNCHPHIPICPTALIWPVLVTLVLERGDNHDLID